jgi:acyl dehydratase
MGSDGVHTKSDAMTAKFNTTVDDRYLEDYVPGSVHEFGTIAVEEAEVVAFGRRYDPQLFHTDSAAAQSTVFGGLIASGWQTAGFMMRLTVQHYLSHVASLGSPGVDELRWPQPVRPGDTLSVRATVLSARRSKSKPDRGIVETSFEVLNQRGEVVMTAKAINMLKARSA